jgi:hypothetical protein
VKGEQVRTRDRMCVRLHMPTGGGCGHVLLPAPAMQQRQPATSCNSTVYGVQGKGWTLGHYGHNTCTDNHAFAPQQGCICPCAGCHPPHKAANLASCSVWGGAIRAPGLPVRGQSGAGSRQKDCATSGAGCWQAIAGALAGLGWRGEVLGCTPLKNSASGCLCGLLAKATCTKENTARAGAGCGYHHQERRGSQRQPKYRFTSRRTSRDAQIPCCSRASSTGLHGVCACQMAP